MLRYLNPLWKQQLQSELEKPYFKELEQFVEQAYKKNVCYPPKNQIFEAFNQTAFNAVNVVILGQDPYHGPGQAHGLSFSVKPPSSIPPSLKNIFKELTESCNLPMPNNGDLSHWAKQGVLLLNATLTVEANKAGSHQKKGWEKFTDAVIKKISNEQSSVVFLLWGGMAKKKVSLIDTNKHYVLTAGHPSPLSANRGYWFNNNHFKQTNVILKSLDKTPIQW